MRAGFLSNLENEASEGIGSDTKKPYLTRLVVIPGSEQVFFQHEKSRERFPASLTIYRAFFNVLVPNK